jgi:hypothetical protein
MALKHLQSALDNLALYSDRITLIRLDLMGLITNIKMFSTNGDFRDYILTAALKRWLFRMFGAVNKKSGWMKEAQAQ